MVFYFMSFKSIYTKLFLLFFIIGVVPLITGSFYAYSNSRGALLNAALKEQDLKTTIGMRNIVTLFVESGIHLRLTARNTAFARYFEDPSEKETYRTEQENAMLGIFSSLQRVVESTGFSDINGKVITSLFEGEPVSYGSSHPPVSERPFFRQALKLEDGRIFYGRPEFSRGSQKWVIPVAVPVCNQDGICRGVLWMQIYLDNVKRFIRGIAHEEDNVVVVDGEGYVMAQSGRDPGEILKTAVNPGDHSSYALAIRLMLAGDSGNLPVFLNGERFYMTYKQIPGDVDNQNRWSIAILTPEETIYAGVNAKKYILFVLSASSVLFAIAGIFGWRIARPIREITLTSVSMSKGDLSRRVNIRRGDEIGQLASAFNEMAASIQTSHDELVRLSTTDGLTGLYNHREFQKRLGDEIKRASRYKAPLSLLMLDIDNFKRFNDTYGHPAGDIVLRSIGALILREIRSSDFAARYGGEEMAVVLTETGADEAFIFSERIRGAIQQFPVTVLGGETVQVTVSIGIGSFPEDAPDRKTLIDVADQALYFAKTKGRNKSILYRKTLKAVLEHKQEAHSLLQQAEESIFKDLATSVEAKLPYRRGYFEAVTRTALQIAKTLQLDAEKTTDLRIASMIYEIGALSIPNRILLKEGPLNEEEWKIVKTHPETSVKILGDILKIRNVLPAILHHHERYDGAGYPSGLKGEEIPLLARILAVADAYQAMTSVSPYRRKLTRKEALDELKRHAGTRFDPAIIETFFGALSKHEKESPDSAISE